ncbi:hypothetical protein [Sphingomonas solaris]|uniref:DUF2892 domain-containing protein n=1 Tax=Alterirhizorhabdus solaris TaxID=2529389 RepID=A0A558QST6_9SPHN|nr:hypothetical protein [Sphingomonas solaris]TVV70132.1 hypothetical protein FOY91_19835 [Sphingomonas solaris]
MNLSPDERDRLARVRFTIISAARASGLVLMIFGLWIWLGDLVRAGGWMALGLPLFAIGLFESLVLPQILVSRWRSER